VTRQPTSAQEARALAPVGVFDSGVGGLTVLSALTRALPSEDFVYLGDTARLPYGTKSAASIRRYALQAAALLQERRVKCLVVACNTASAVAVEDLTQEFAPVPVVGVLEPGAAAACRATRTGRIDDLFGKSAADARPDTLVLGCTHFPVIASAIASVVGPAVTIVDSAATTAEALVGVLARQGLERPAVGGALTLLATDGAERFARVGGTFLGQPVAPERVEIVDLAAYHPESQAAGI
jgi:glutamate racemase